jgi:molecular chaperone GrpE
VPDREDKDNVSHEETTPVADEAITSAGAAAENAEAQVEQPAGDTAAQLVPAEQLAAMRKEIQDYKDGWMRERADFANYKKRVETQMKDMRENATIEALISLLPIIDDLERAMASIPGDMKENPWIGGMNVIHRKFLRLLEDKGVTTIDPVGQPFDPKQHEAVVREDSSAVESGHVTETLQKGYVRGERVLRQALVKVAN